MRRRWLLVSLGALASACGDGSRGIIEPPLPQPGVLTVRWTTPHTTDAAVRLTLRGPQPGTVESARPEYTTFSAASDNGRVVIVFGPLESGDLITFGVPDVGAYRSYSLELNEVARETDELRSDLSAYRLSVAPVPAQ